MAADNAVAKNFCMTSNVPEKYLFLDMDGVVCINGTLCDQLLMRVRSIVQATNCHVVLSSDWRRTNTYRKLAATCLERFGVRLHGYTPVLSCTL